MPTATATEPPPANSPLCTVGLIAKTLKPFFLNTTNLQDSKTQKCLYANIIYMLFDQKFPNQVFHNGTHKHTETQHPDTATETLDRPERANSVKERAPE